ncbi:MAG: GGDEF domain-containing protein [Coprococcus sp.]|nr:GGDEF domain-containing protein [Coprococcus sp.]
MTNNRLNIGLFTCHLDNDYALEVCKGAEYAAKEQDVNLIVFPGMFLNSSFNDPENELYDYQYNSIYYYAHPDCLDALIISVGAIAPFLSEKNINDFLSHFEGIPILTLDTKIPGYPCLKTDNTKGLETAIEHLIHVHNRKHICFVSGRTTNADAMQRLEIYRQTMAEHNLPVFESMIVYGDMSEYTTEIVGQLLDNNPDTDAIIFANDQMAVGGYNELKRRGIHIGSDISVIGIDDSPVGVTLDPPLTTVSINSCDLGYRSIYEAISLCTTGKINDSLLQSCFIQRLSCNCELFSLTETDDVHPIDNTVKSVDDIILMLDKILLSDVKGSFYADMVYDKFNCIFRDILIIAQNPEAVSYPKAAIIDKLKSLLHSPLTDFFSVPKISLVFKKFASLFTTRELNPEKRLEFNKLNSYITSTISLFLSTKLYNEMRDNKMSAWSSIYITRDTLTYGRDIEKTYSLIINKLKELGFDGAYIYTYDDDIKITETGNWIIPKSLFLQAYYNANNKGVLFGESRRTPSIEIFDNEYTYYDKRFTAVLVPIFTNEQHHGLFICNTDVSNFKNIYSTSLQLGASLKYMALLEEQTTIQEQLRMSLNEIHEKNELLNHLSTSDELTGVNNRRGFMEKVEFLINMPANRNRKAMLLFADMDSLKVVNDKFGHKDGDFALRNIANILVSSFRVEDIIGRIGGDEFVCFAFVDEPDFITNVQEKINELSDELNENCGKPYFIEMSVGVSEFICDSDVKMEDLISQADNSLYSNKRYKRISVIK